MTVASKVEKAPGGLQVKASDTEIGMSWPHRIIEFSVPHKDEIIWTMGIGDCCAVGTYDHNSGKRTLCHLPGSQGTEGYFNGLATAISDNTTIIIASGTNTGTEQGFKDTTGNSIYQRLMDALTKQHKIIAASNWVTFWTSEAADDTAGMRKGSFGLTADGKYGRILADKVL